MATEAEILASRRARARALSEAGEPLFPARVPRDLAWLPALHERFANTSAEELERAGERVRVAGRVMALRSFGKAVFATLQADGVRLQIWVKRAAVGEEAFARFRLYEVGDFLWAAGSLIRTRTGELTVDVSELGFLAKAYRPLPEKWHGLQDVEARSRQRYLDLLMNERSRQIAVARSRLIRAARELLDGRGFLEVETPILQPLYGGASARPFVTHHNVLDEDLYLRVSDELYLKRLVIGGIDRVYEIGRDFRNEGVSRKHNPEFTMLEVYQAYADYHDMMELVEALVAHAALAVLGTTKVEHEAGTIDLAPPWPRHTMTELIRESCGIDIERSASLEALGTEVRRAGLEGIDPQAALSWAGLVDEVWSAVVEPRLIQPTIVMDYPVALSPLAKRCADRPQLVERFEAFIGGMEIGNAFSELNDPDDQRERFLEQVRARQRGDEEAQPLDEDFLLALEHGMPPTGGLGVGIGRLVMVLTNAPHLREVKLFPHLRRRHD